MQPIAASELASVTTLCKESPQNPAQVNLVERRGAPEFPFRLNGINAWEKMGDDLGGSRGGETGEEVVLVLVGATMDDDGVDAEESVEELGEYSIAKV